jgi:hypothetical protein
MFPTQEANFAKTPRYNEVSGKSLSFLIESQSDSIRNEYDLPEVLEEWHFAYKCG